MRDFDITKHKWDTKGDIIIHVYDEDELSFDSGNAFAVIRKQDAIAIAKHFGLTRGDLE